MTTDNKQVTFSVISCQLAVCALHPAQSVTLRRLYKISVEVTCYCSSVTLDWLAFHLKHTFWDLVVNCCQQYKRQTL